MKFSVVLAVYNVHNTIEKTIQSLQNQTFKDFEVIFVDSSPNDLSSNIIKKYPEFKLVKSNKRLYAGVARNLGVEHAKGEILAFTDPDCIQDKDWLLKLNESFNKGFNTVGGSIACYPDDLVSYAAHITKFWKWLPVEKYSNIDIIIGGNFSIKKNLFLEVGGFYKKKLSSQDTELCYRLLECKERIIFNGSAVVTHIHNIKLISLIKLRYIRGKEFAMMRISTIYWNKFYSLLFLILFPILPFKNFFEKMFVCSKRKYLMKFILTSPIILLCEIAWMTGQFIIILKSVIIKSTVY
ncbi:glycosyltransferase family 2 protein [Bacteroidota bacterium]